MMTPILSPAPRSISSPRLSHVPRRGRLRIALGGVAALAAALAVLGGCATAPAGKTSGLGGAADSAADDAMIAQGVRLHDAGRYDEAVRTYLAVLERSPDNVVARYELAMSYAAQGDHARAIEAAEAGIRYDHPLRPSFFVVLGSAHDDRGSRLAAIGAYSRGIALYPNEPMLHMNLGLTYLRAQLWDKARLSLERALVLDPGHANTHVLLAVAYDSGRFPVPSLFAATRALLDDPPTPQSKVARGVLAHAFSTGIVRDPGTGDVKITMDPNPRFEEGDFQAAELALKLWAAAPSRDVALPPLADKLATILGIAVESAEPEAPGFAADFYLPYYAAAHAAHHLEALAAFALRDVDPAMAPWLRAHEAEVRAFLAWSAAFTWPRPTVAE